MLKILSILIYTLLLRAVGPVLILLGVTTSLDFHSVFWMLTLVMILPEFACCFPKFRSWIKDGIEDSDQKFNSSDFYSLMRHYSTLWCIRLFVLFGLLEAFYGIQVREVFVLGSLAGAFGIQTINFFLGKREKEKSENKPNNERI